MKRISIIDFKNFCKQLNPKYYIYDTVNQNSFKDKSLRVVSKYEDISIFLAPDAIQFKNNNGNLCLNNVKEIIVDDSIKTVRVVFTIVCGNDNIKRYIILAE